MNLENLQMENGSERDGWELNSQSEECKLFYSRPKLVCYGDLRSLTLSGSLPGGADSFLTKNLIDE